MAMSFYISQPESTPRAYQGLSDGDVASMANLPLQVEQPHPTMPAVMVGEPSPAAPFIHQVAKAHHAIGDRLSQAGWSGFGEALCYLAQQSQGNPVAFVDKVSGKKGSNGNEILENLIPIPITFHLHSWSMPFPSSWMIL